jgi:hypothetical protein
VKVSFMFSKSVSYDDISEAYSTCKEIRNSYNILVGNHKSVCSLRDVAVAKKILKWLF